VVFGQRKGGLWSNEALVFFEEFIVIDGVKIME
jgi:hypothetical protein